MAPSPLADMSPESAARALAIIAHEARVKQAAGGVVDTLKDMASTGTKAVGDAASQAMVSGGDAVAKIRDWFAAHPELKAPLIGAGAGALLAGGNAAIRKKRNPLGAALLGGITGAGLGGAYSALSGAGGDAQTEKIDQAGDAAEAARRAAMTGTERLGERVAPVAGALGAVTSGSGEAVKDMGQAALEHPVASAGAALGATGGIRHGRDKTLLANIRANTRTPGDVKALYPDVPYQPPEVSEHEVTPMVPGGPAGPLLVLSKTDDGYAAKAMAPTTGPDPRAQLAVELSERLANPAFKSEMPQLRGQFASRDRHNFSRAVLGTNDYATAGPREPGIRPGAKGWADLRPIPLTQVGRQAAYARRVMTDDNNWGIARPPASGGLAPRAANVGGQALRGLGGGISGGLLGYGIERLGKGLLGTMSQAPPYAPGQPPSITGR